MNGSELLATVSQAARFRNSSEDGEGMGSAISVQRAVLRTASSRPQMKWRRKRWRFEIVQWSSFGRFVTLGFPIRSSASSLVTALSIETLSLALEVGTLPKRSNKHSEHGIVILSSMAWVCLGSSSVV